MELKTILWELRDDGIGILTLNRPERMNAISAQFVADFNDILDYLMDELDCRVVLMKGAGRAFCAGSDLKEGPVINKRRVPEEYQKFKFLDVPNDSKRTHYYQRKMAQIVVKMRRITQPVIGLIHGPAIGGGFTFSMACDIRIVTKGAYFNIGAINRGMGGGDLGGSHLLPRLIGMSRAAELMYTGRNIGAEEAERIGLVLKIVEEDKLLESGLELAKILLSKSPLGLRLTKEGINASMSSPSLEDAIKLDNRAQTICSTSRDITTAMQSYVEKKEPEYPLR